MAFWQEKRLDQMNREEWESLCDGCARCCLVKLEDEENGELHYTALACRELYLESCRCRHYESRLQRVSECVALTAETLAQYDWLPSSCAYRLLAAGKALPDWHPLVSGDAESVHAAGISVRNFAVPEQVIDDSLDIEDYLLDDNL